MVSTILANRILWNPEHPFLRHFTYLKALADRYGVTAKLDIPGPNIVLLDTITTAQELLSGKPADMAITLRLCQGNLRSRKFYDATYDEIADTISSLPFDGYFIEFDDEKYCDFKLLRKLRGQKAALGVVSTRSSDLEDKNVLLAWVRAAAEYCSPEQICVSTQCGFASTAEGNLITEEAQWAKRDLVREVAEAAF